jgi:hypothetical protein
MAIRNWPAPLALGDCMWLLHQDDGYQKLGPLGPWVIVGTGGSCNRMILGHEILTFSKHVRCMCMVVVASYNIDVSWYVASLVWGSTWRQDSWYEITWIDCQNVMLYELVSWCDFSYSFSTSMCMTLSPEFETSALSSILSDAVFYGHYLSRLLGPLEF